MKGYNGKIARVDLSTGDVKVEVLPEEFYRSYIGGSGFIAHTLLREVPMGIDPFEPENRLIFALGPITGHPFVGSGRNSIGCKSPLSGGYGESEVGGFWGAELKRAGFDAIIIEGASDHPVYLWITDNHIEIRDGSGIWGMEVADTHHRIQKELGQKARTAIIGPAGEKRIRYACIINDTHHAAGRSGIGAVMGSKKLKAIAVKGSRAPEVADRKKLMALNRWMAENYRNLSKNWVVGTGRGIVNHEKTGNVPIRNFQGGRFPGIENIDPQRLCDQYLERMGGCFGCPVRCKRIVKLEKPWSVDPIYGAPEYETLAALGSNCDVDNLEAVVKANELCNRLGLDTISTGVTISFAMECFEKGLLSKADTDGLELRFGNAEAMIEMVRRIGRREGLGDLLAEGSRRAAEKIGGGATDFSIQVKGEEIPMHEPRFKQTLGLHYSIHATGADHGTGLHETSPISKESAKKLYNGSLFPHLVNHIGLCRFVAWTDRQVLEGIEHITGWRMEMEELAAVVDRGVNLARVFNIREGFTDQDDMLPKRFSQTPADSALQGIDMKQLAAAQKAYYGLMGWDASGKPTRETLSKLEISWAEKYL